MNFRKFLDWFHLAFLVITPIIILLLPADYFNNGQALCPSMRFFNVECPGCGMTRAVMHLVHFDFESALFYNWGSFIVVPILGVYWLLWTKKAYDKVREKEPAIVA